MVDSIPLSTKRSYEIIFSSYLPCPENLQDLCYIKYVKDYGSACRAACIASTLAEGRYISWASDDGYFLPGGLDRAIDLLEAGDNHMDVVSANFIEGIEGHKLPQTDDACTLVKGYPYSSYLNPNWVIFNLVVMHRSYFEYLGGWDARFQATAFAHADLAARAQRDGCNIHFLKEPIADFDWIGSTGGDHAPIHYAMTGHDEALYNSIYQNEDCIDRIEIPFDNWKASPLVWDKRFLVIDDRVKAVS